MLVLNAIKKAHGVGEDVIQAIHQPFQPTMFPEKFIFVWSGFTPLTNPLQPQAFRKLNLLGTRCKTHL